MMEIGIILTKYVTIPILIIFLLGYVFRKKKDT